MTPERLDQIQELYHSARDSEPGERQRFLAQACRGDEELRREVESLLAQDSGVMNRPAVEVAAELLATGHFDTGMMLGPYRIEGLLGAGGMGRVYKATDTRLDRLVAIKVAQERFSDRFEREARVVAALNHPNICTLHDIGPNYLVMEYIDGRPLKGPLAAAQAIPYALQILDALDAAHAKGIVHRDLKPANILAAKSNVKLLDFGLAKQMRDSPGPDEETQTMSLTRTGAIMGTPAYMAPEQWEGKPADARSDIYAFGCLLYEMLTGKRAGADRAPVKPAALEAVIVKCLARDPAERFQTVAEIRPRLQHKPATIQRKYIVAAGVAIALLAAGTWLWLRAPWTVHALNDTDKVLLIDFANSTGEQVFDRTLTEALATQLSQSPFLNIIADQEVNDQLKLMGRSPKDALDEKTGLEVCQRAEGKALIEGSIAKAGRGYLIAIKALNCRTGKLMTQSQAEASKAPDVLEALQKAEAGLRTKLGESLATVEKYDVPLQRATTSSLEALKAYSMARKSMLDSEPGPCVELAQHAIDLDANFAMAHQTLGLCDLKLQKREPALEQLRIAFSQREGLSEWEKFAVESRYYRSVAGDLEKARQTYETWSFLYKRDPIALENLAEMDAHLGDYDKAIVTLNATQQLDPKPANLCLLASYEISANRPGDAGVVLKELLDRNPDLLCVHLDLFVLSYIQNNAAGLAEQFDWLDKKNQRRVSRQYRIILAAAAGQVSKVRELGLPGFEEARARGIFDGQASYHIHVAVIEALFGETKDAVNLVREAVTQSTEEGNEITAGLVAGLGGDSSTVGKLVSDLDQRFPDDTIVQFLYLPTIRAALYVADGHPLLALQQLAPTKSYQFGHAETGSGVPALSDVYVRGLAYLANRQGKEAAADFQTILDHRGIILSGTGEPYDVLAHFYLARAYALQGDTDKARAAYQDFLTILKDADPDLPVLKEAQTEYKKLN